MMKLNTMILATSTLATLLLPGVALAQGQVGASGSAEGSAGGSLGSSGGTAEGSAAGSADSNPAAGSPATGGTAVSEAPATPAPVTTGEAVPVAPTGATDHAAVVGTFGIGYLGTSGVQIQDLVSGAVVTAVAPILGVRYWVTPRWGIDAGLGFGIAGATDEPGNGTSVDVPQPIALALHGGVPLALMDSSHFVFEVVPEFNLGFASNTVTNAMAGDVSLSGFHFDLGAHAGAEIHFGFIDLPRLALQAGVGLYLQMNSWTTDPDNGAKISHSEYSFGTAAGPAPWSLFTGNLAAVYYF